MTICEGDTAQLTASANIPNGTFTWYHSSDLATSIGSGASILVSDLNTPSEQFYVIYEINDCSDTAIVNVTVNENPLLNIIESNFSVCATSTSILSVEISPPSITGTYIWAHDPSLGYCNIVSVSPQQTSTFSVFFVSDDNCFSNSDSVTITVIQNPVADIVASDTSICLGDSVLLSSAFTGLTFNWSSNETTEQITANFMLPGSYTFSLTTSITGCTENATDSIEIIVNPVPEIDQFTISADSICLGEEVTVSSTVEPNWRYIFLDTRNNRFRQYRAI